MSYAKDVFTLCDLGTEGDCSLFLGGAALLGRLELLSAYCSANGLHRLTMVDVVEGEGVKQKRLMLAEKKRMKDGFRTGFRGLAAF